MISDGYGHNSNDPGHPQQQLQQQQLQQQQLLQQEEEDQSSLPTLEDLDPELSFLYTQDQPQQFQNLNQQSNLNIQPSDTAMAGILLPHNGNFLQPNLITGSSNCSPLKRSYPNGVQEQNFSKYQRTENQPVFNNGGNFLLNNQDLIPDFASDFAAMKAQLDVAERCAMAQSFENQVLLHNLLLLVENLMERVKRMETRAKQRHDEVISRLNRLEEKGGPCVTKWLNEEVVALIDARRRMDNEFTKADGKGLWEKLSTEMEKLGFIKDAKKCKEKWDNITKYYTKKMKEESQGKMTTTTKSCCYIELLRDHYAQKPPGVDSSVSSVNPCSTASSHINKVDHQSKVNSEKGGDDNQRYPNA